MKNFWSKFKYLFIYLLSLHFVDKGIKSGLLSKNNKKFSLIKNKTSNYCNINCKYNDMYIGGYSDGIRMSSEKLRKTILMLKADIPVCSPYKENAYAQINGFEKALETIIEGKIRRKMKLHRGKIYFKLEGVQI